MWTLGDCTQVANNRLRGVAAGGGGGLGGGTRLPHFFLTHRQYFHPRSLICYLDLSDLTFSQSQGKSSLGRVCHELQISCCSRGFIHSLLCSLAVWGKMHPRKKLRTITSFFFSNTHSKYVWCRDDTIHVIRFPCYDLTYCNQASTVRPFKSHLRLKATTCESTMTKYLGAPVQLTDQHICVCAEGASKVSNLLAFAIE